jgi:hypothetical protein
MDRGAISIRKTYAGKHVLLSGGSGFLGKVWLAMVLDQIPDIGKIYLLLRRNGYASVKERLEAMLSTSYVFKTLHERLGGETNHYLSTKLEAIEGDVTLPHLGLEPSVAARLRERLDLFVNCVGLVDFNPDVRDAVAINVIGTNNVADFVESCTKAGLLHVSTCYVAGRKEGVIEEAIETRFAPNGSPFDVEQELSALNEAIVNVALKHESNHEVEAELAHKLQEHRASGHGSVGNGNGKTEKLMTVLRRKTLRKSMIQEGMERAKRLGWPNTYTYTKAMADAFLKKRENLRFAVFRPSIVESSFAYPFPGWNEGFNTSGPLAYLLRTWFHYLPSTVGNPFDIIPVDLVCKGLVIAGAAVLLDRHREVYHCGTSDRNRFTIDRACELTSLGHRVHYRKNGKNAVEKVVLSRWDTVPAPSDHFLSMKRIAKTAENLSRALKKIPGTARAAKFLEKKQRKLAQISDMLDLFLPFIHDHFQIFKSESLASHSIEEKEFEYSPESIEWRNYWMNIHMPGLRRWCFPAIEGGKVESYTPAEPVRLVEGNA